MPNTTANSPCRTRSKDIAQAVGAPANMTPAKMAQAIRMATGGRLLTTAKIPTQALPEVQDDLTAQKTDARRVIKRLVGQLSRSTDTRHSYIHAEMNRMLGDTVTTATLESLNKRIDMLEKKVRSYR